MITPYWIKYFENHLGEMDVWQIERVSPYPPCTTSDEVEYFAVVLEFNNENFTIIVNTDDRQNLSKEDLSILKSLKVKIEKERKRQKVIQDKKDLDWSIVKEFEKFKYVHSVWPADSNKEVNIREISFRDFDLKFQNKLKEFLENYK